ncbi:SpoIID/LytB domain-containing protein [candidate division WOR-3 bacterium]|nr:SpoIID/LytB domain-containing protein [candidate division WOR-3 bacterium]
MGDDSEKIKRNLIRVKVDGPKTEVLLSFVEKSEEGFLGDFMFRKSGDDIYSDGRTFPSPLRIRGSLTVVRGITVGGTFHWEHTEDHAFRGIIEVLSTPQGLVLVNELPFEHYIVSVVGSEMKSQCSLEFLKVQAILARSSAFSMSKKLHSKENFHLCADDHCQDYRGVLRENEKIIKAVSETAGEFLLFENKIADCRFSKICGGITAEFKDAWTEEVPHPYMPGKYDCLESTVCFERIEEYVNSDFHEALCSPAHYKPEEFSYSKDYYRWERTVSKKAVSDNLLKLGFDIGEIVSAAPKKITSSFRVTEIEFTGKIGKCLVKGELNIRKALSADTLPSASFYLKDYKDHWVCKGAGWGHGVGMCQIGAMTLAEKGFDPKSILKHYFPGCRVAKLYSFKEFYEKKWTEKRPCYEKANCYELKRCIHGATGDGPQDCKGKPPLLK